MDATNPASATAATTAPAAPAATESSSGSSAASTATASSNGVTLSVPGSNIPPAAKLATPAPAISDTEVSDGSVGVCQARIVTGDNRLQVLVNGEWYDVDGISTAMVLSTDPRVAARVDFKKISTITRAAAGANPIGVAARARTSMHQRSSAPIQNTRTGTVSRPAGLVSSVMQERQRAIAASKATAAAPAAATPAASTTETATAAAPTPVA